MTAPIANYTGGVEIEGKLYYGLDAEIALKQQAKFDYDLERRLREWIEETLNEKLEDEDLGNALKSGIVLCNLMNKIKPGIIKKINRPKGKKAAALMEMENIKLYLNACWQLGLPGSSLFTSTDLYNRRGLTEVLRNLEALARFTQTLDDCNVAKWSGPQLSKRRPDEKKWATVEIEQPKFIQDQETEENIDLRAELVKAQAKIARLASHNEELMQKLNEKKDETKKEEKHHRHRKHNSKENNDKHQVELEHLRKVSLQYWEEIRQLKSDLSSKDTQLQQLQVELIALKNVSSSSTTSLSTIVSPRLEKAPSMRAEQLFGLGQAAHDSATHRFLAKLREGVVSLLQHKDEGNNDNYVAKIADDEIRSMSKILKTELGRRQFTKVLQNAIFSDPSTLHTDAFEMILFLFNEMLQEMQVDETHDLIAASAVMRMSSLIKRKSLNGGENEFEFVSEFICNYDIFRQKQFWTETFFDDLIEKCKKNSVVGNDDNDDDTYELDQQLVEPLMMFSIHRMALWGCSMSLVQSVVMDILSLIQLEKETQLRLKDGVVKVFSEGKDKKKDKK